MSAGRHAAAVRAGAPSIRAASGEVVDATGSARSALGAARSSVPPRVCLHAARVAVGDPPELGQLACSSAARRLRVLAVGAR